MLSIIVPCYNEEEVIGLFYTELMKVINENKIKYELILVNDGSRDKTLEEFEKLTKIDKNVKYINFSRNFGKEAAILAGLEASSGEYVVLMDADLQDPPFMLVEMLKVVESKEYDSVATRRVTRTGEPKIKSFFARLFYKLINKMSDADIVDGARDYRMMTRQMADSILSLSEYHRFSKGIFGWVGYNTKWLDYENIERAAGETKWSFFKLFKYAIEGIVSFSTTPLRFATIAGILTCIFTFIYFVYIIINTMISGIHVPGYASTMVVILFLGGIQLLTMGITGEYLAKTYMEVKKRPIYIIKDKKNFK